MINVVCAVIQDSQGRFLVCQRAEGKSLAGKWEFPGGKVESGEEERETLQREIMEELNCLVSVEEPLTVVEHHYPEFSICLIPFLCKLKEGSPEMLEHAGYRWQEVRNFPVLDWAEADVRVWQEVTKKAL